MFYAPSFWFKTFEKVLVDVPDTDIEQSCGNVLVVFYHAEETDVDRRSSVLTKFIKNVKKV